MKKLIAFSIIFIAIFSMNSCKKVDKLTQFHINYNSSVTIPKTLGIDLPINVITPDINTESSSDFESNNTLKSLIQEVYPTEITLTITSPNDANFDFLKNIEISISADGLSEKKIAWLNDIPKTGLSEIVLEVSSDNLKEYILKDSFKLKTSTTTRELVSHDTDVDIHTRFFVNASILGV
jgi:hypothetical protein